MPHRTYSCAVLDAHQVKPVSRTHAKNLKKMLRLPHQKKARKHLFFLNRGQTVSTSYHLPDAPHASTSWIGKAQRGKSIDKGSPESAAMIAELQAAGYKLAAGNHEYAPPILYFFALAHPSLS